MNPRRSVASVLLHSAAAFLAIVGSGASPAHGDTGSDARFDDPTDYVVQSGDLALSMRRDGRLDSPTRARVWLRPRATQSFEVAEVLTRSGPVHKGDVLIRFDRDDLEKNLRSARERLESARVALDMAREDGRLTSEATARGLEESGKALADAQQELGIWEKFESSRTLRSLELQMEQSESGLADQKAELDQLEKMYAGTHLSSETKDIVLERARRGVRISEGWLQLTRAGQVVEREFRYPVRDRNVRDSLRWRTMEFDHARRRAEQTRARSTETLAVSERAVRDAEERLYDLETDAECLVLKAPADGILTLITQQLGDSVAARQVVAEIVDPAQRIARFDALAADLRFLNVGRDVTLSLPEYPEVSLSGHVTSIAAVGTASGDDTRFTVEVAVDGTNLLARVGVRCAVEARTVVSNVLTIPRKAVIRENNRDRCDVRAASGTVERRDITLGASNNEFVQVVGGLMAGEAVLLPAESAQP